MGPITPGIASAPGEGLKQSLKGRRLLVGFQPTAGPEPALSHSSEKLRPLKAEGPRIEPPISVPKPTMADPKAIEAASPPEDPPGVSFVLWGFTVTP